MRYVRIGWIGALLTVVLMLSQVILAGGSPGDAVDRFYAAYGDRSLEAMLASYTSDAVFEDVAQRHHFEGPEQITQLLGSLVAMHHEMAVVEKRRAIQGNVVVVEYEYVGKLNGAALGQAVGKEGCPDLDYVLPATSWYEVQDGKIARQRDFIDLATYQELRQRMLDAAN